MRRAWRGAAALWLGAAAARLQAQSAVQHSPGNRMSQAAKIAVMPAGTHQGVFVAPGFGELRYTIEVPSRPDPAAPPPLVLALHYGFDPNAPFPPYYGRGLLEGLVGPGLASLGAVIVAPDSHGRRWTDAALAAAVLGLVEAAASAYAADRRRVLITGYSLGGIGTWYLSMRSPQTFGAAIVMSARPDTGATQRFPPIPLYVIHSRRDEVFPAAEVTAAVEALRAAGREVAYDLLDAPTHFDVAAFTPALRRAADWIEHRW